VVLRGLLSNPDFQDLLQSLTSQKRRKAPARRPKLQVGRPDGRRKFASVADAVVAVLAATDGEMRLGDIHTQVERALDGPVSLFSVTDFLVRRSKGSKPLFVHTRYGHYSLVR
jgi:hypothetical protein